MQFFRVFLGFLALSFGSFSLAADLADAPMQVEIDARDLPRKLLHAKLDISLADAATEQKVALWYPKWVPGSHGPGGPVANIGGLRIEDQHGQTLSWLRTPAKSIDSRSSRPHIQRDSESSSDTSPTSQRPVQWGMTLGAVPS